MRIMEVSMDLKYDFMTKIRECFVLGLSNYLNVLKAFREKSAACEEKK